MDPSHFYGKRTLRTRPAGGYQGESDDSCLSDDSDSDYVPVEPDNGDDESSIDSDTGEWLLIISNGIILK